MKLRIRIPGLDSAALHALDRKARLFLGRHIQSIDSVDISLLERAEAGVQHAECAVTVTLREGGAVSVYDDGSHVHRALLRAAWRIDQRRELGRLRDRISAGPARNTF